MFFERVISPNKPLFSSKLYVDDERCVGCWLFNEAGGDLAHDISIHGHHGQFSNGPTWVGGNFSAPALDFDFTSDQSISVGDPSTGVLDFGTGDYAIALWANVEFTSQGSSINTLVAKDVLTGGTGTGPGIWIRTANVVEFGTFSTAATHATAINDGWHFMVGVRTGGFNKLYIDTVKGNDTADTLSLANDDSLTIGIDSTSETRFIGGRIDHVRMYNAALSQAEINALFNNPFHDIKELRPMVFGFTVAAPVTFVPQVIMIR